MKQRVEWNENWSTVDRTEVDRCSLQAIYSMYVRVCLCIHI